MADNIFEMKVKPLGESIAEVVIGSWVKNDGDTIAMDEILGEIESDKATFEITAEVAGVLRIVAKAGDTLKIGDLMCKIEVGAGANASKTTPKTDVKAEAKTEAKAETKTEAKAETKTEAKAEAKTEAKAETKEATSDKESYAKGVPSTAAAKILSEKDIDPKTVGGTGVDGRITKEDALNAEKTKEAVKETPKEAVKETPKDVPASSNGGLRSQKRERMTTMRKTIARRLVAVKNETAMLTTFNEVNMKPVMEMRTKYKDKFKEKHSVGLGFMSFFTAACAAALLEFPMVNAQIDGEEFVLNDFADISVAVSTEKGLVVPVIRNAEQMSFAQIEKEIVRLATRAREGKLTIPEMTGGTFTITNGGVFGSMMSTPIINAPQSAILGMHNIVERPMAVNGEVKILPMMYLALSYDHRIIDGKDSVSFLVRVKQLLEEPERLILGM